MAFDLDNLILPGDNTDVTDTGTGLEIRVQGSGWTAIVALTQAAYDALDPPDSTTLYFITDA